MSAPVKIAITMGDPAGTGAELITKALSSQDIYENCQPMVIGDAATLERALSYTGVKASIHRVTDPGQIDPRPDRIEVLNMENVNLEAIKPGQARPRQVSGCHGDFRNQ